jgi:flagellar protein FliO/FliZ
MHSLLKPSLLCLLLAAIAPFASVAHAEDQVIYPRAPAPVEAPANRSDSGLNPVLLALALGAAGAGGWLLWRQRRAAAGAAGRDARKLAIAESRPLGNRQYLVVANYDGRKFLLGVCPGRIDLLSPLDDPPASKPS